MEQRAVIRFLIVKGRKSKAILAELERVDGDAAPALATVKKWRKPFHEGRTDRLEGSRSGRPLTHDLAEVWV
jgi:hypothetical protein